MTEFAEVGREFRVHNRSVGLRERETGGKGLNELNEFIFFVCVNSRIFFK